MVDVLQAPQNPELQAQVNHQGGAGRDGQGFHQKKPDGLAALLKQAAVFVDVQGQGRFVEVVGQQQLNLLAILL